MNHQSDILRIDIETYSGVDLRKVGPYRYVEDSSFRILMAGYAINDDPVQVVTDPDDIDSIPGLWDPAVVKVAHNAQFERICFSRFNQLGCATIDTPIDDYLIPDDWIDTMALAAWYGYPRSLDKLAKALGVDPKDSAGTRLINLFCRPARDGRRVRPEDRPAEWAEFLAYCAQDVETLRQVHQAMPPAPTLAERQLWNVDQLINDRGMAIDVPMARAAEKAAAANQVQQRARVIEITGVANPGSVMQLKRWLEGRSHPLPSLAAPVVEEALAGPLEDDVREVLELRQELALSASAKYTSALESVCEDGRLRGSFAFHGAHTGRWAGRRVQPQNLPRAALASPQETEAAILDLKLGLGGSAHTLKALVRALFTGPLTVVDYASIEARVVAWLADEEWALGAFYAGRDIYVETAQRMGTALNTEFSRAQGKVAVLALGYNGGPKSLSAMGATGTYDELRLLVQAWRMANPSIVGYWSALGDVFRLGGQLGRVIVEKDGSDRAIVLPSGRPIWYRKCAFGWKTNDWGKRVRTITFTNDQGIRSGTYGGRLTENVTQAVARDVLGAALVRLENAGYPVVGHVHDEVLIDGEHPVADVVATMCADPGWADGLPLGGEGFVCDRYRKG